MVKYIVEARGEFGGTTGGWRPAITGTLNQTTTDDLTASTFATEYEADLAIDFVIAEGLDADDVRVVETV